MSVLIKTLSLFVLILLSYPVAAKAGITEWQLHQYIQKSIRTDNLKNIRKLLPLVFFKEDHWRDAVNLYLKKPSKKKFMMVKLFLELGINNTNRSLALFQAVRYTNVELLELLLSHGANPNIRNEKYDTPLQFIEWKYPLNTKKKKKYTRMIELLIEYGANVHTRDERGVTLMMHSLSLSDKHFLQFLLNHGADINAYSDRYSVLSMGVAIGNKALVKWLIENGADLNQTTDYGQPPLETAIAKKYRELADLLRQYGAKEQLSIEKTTNTKKEEAREQREDAYISLLRFNEVEKFVNLIEDKYITPESDPNAIYRAAWFCRAKALDELLKHGWDANYTGKGNFRKPLLTEVSKSACYEGMKVLLEHGANPNVSTEPLVNALFFGDLEMVKLLVSYQANIFSQLESPDIFGKILKSQDYHINNVMDFPLETQKKMKGEFAEIANFAVKKGFSLDPSSRYFEESEIIFLLKRKGFFDTAAKLVSSVSKKKMHHFEPPASFADQSIEDIILPIQESNVMKSSIVKPKGQKTIALAHETRPTPATHLDDKIPEREMVSPSEIVDKESPLYWLNQRFFQAVIAVNIPLVRSLLQQGADVNTIQDGMSALESASWSGSGHLVELLLKSGAKQTVKYKSIRERHALLMKKRASQLAKKTAEQAKKMVEQASQQAIKIDVGTFARIVSRRSSDAYIIELLKQGFDINQKNLLGETALMRIQHNFSNVVFLLKHGANPNIQNNLGQTALMLIARYSASKSKFSKLIERMLAYGANPAIKDNNGNIALDYCNKGIKAYEDQFSTSSPIPSDFLKRKLILENL